MKRKKYNTGGIVPIEAEGGEIYQTPNQVVGTDITGTSHGAGGVDMNLPEGTVIYSDKISVGGVTLADRKKKRDQRLKKLNKLLEGTPSKATQNTIDRTLSHIDMEDQQDIAMMEAMRPKNNKQEYAYGGFVNANLPFGQYSLLPPQQHPQLTVPATLTPPTVEQLGTLNTDLQAYNKRVSSNSSPAASGGGPSLIDAMGGPVGAAGVALGAMSTVAGGIAGIKNSREAANAARELNKDYFEDFGRSALQTIEESKDNAASRRQLRRRQVADQLAIDANTQRERNRGSALGLNTLRALDTVTDLGVNRAAVAGNNQVEQMYSTELAQLLGQQSQTQLYQDQTRMGSKARLQQEQEQRLGNFYTQFNAAQQNLYGGLQKIGGNLTSVARNQNSMGLMNELSEYFDLTYNGITNKRRF